MKLKDSLTSWFSVVAFGLTLAFFAIPANAGSTVYVVSFNAINGDGQFGVVDLASGGFHAIGGTAPEQQESLVWGPNGLLYTLGDASGNLETINPATGATTVVGPTGLPFLAPGISSVFSLADLNGNLYLTDHGANFYSVNPITGAATLIGPTGMPPDPAIPGSLNPDGTLNFCESGWAQKSLFPSTRRLSLYCNRRAVSSACCDNNWQPVKWRIALPRAGTTPAG